MEIDFAVHFGVTAYRLNKNIRRNFLFAMYVHFHAVVVFCTHSDVEYFISVSVLSV